MVVPLSEIRVMALERSIFREIGNAYAVVVRSHSSEGGLRQVVNIHLSETVGLLRQGNVSLCCDRGPGRWFGFFRGGFGGRLAGLSRCDVVVGSLGIAPSNFVTRLTETLNSCPEYR